MTTRLLPTISIPLENADVLDTRDDETVDTVMRMRDTDFPKIANANLVLLGQTLGMIRRAFEVFGGRVTVRLNPHSITVQARFEDLRNDAASECGFIIDRREIDRPDWLANRENTIARLAAGAVSKLVFDAVTTK